MCHAIWILLLLGHARHNQYNEDFSVCPSVHVHIHIRLYYIIHTNANVCTITQEVRTKQDGIITITSAHPHKPLHQPNTAPNVLLWSASADDAICAIPYSARVAIFVDGELWSFLCFYFQRSRGLAYVYTRAMLPMWQGSLLTLGTCASEGYSKWVCLCVCPDKISFYVCSQQQVMVPTVCIW